MWVHDEDSQEFLAHFWKNLYGKRGPRSSTNPILSLKNMRDSEIGFHVPVECADQHLGWKIDDLFGSESTQIVAEYLGLALEHKNGYSGDCLESWNGHFISKGSAYYPYKENRWILFLRCLDECLYPPGISLVSLLYNSAAFRYRSLLSCVVRSLPEYCLLCTRLKDNLAPNG